MLSAMLIVVNVPLAPHLLGRTYLLDVSMRFVAVRNVEVMRPANRIGVRRETVNNPPIGV